MAKIPVVCQRCGEFFVAAHLIGGNARVTFTDVGMGPCPKCGGMGKVPDGSYEFIDNSIRLLSGPGITIGHLKKLAAIVLRAKQTNAVAETVRSDVKKDLPELSHLAEALPKTRAELYAFLSLLVALIALLLKAEKSEPKQSVTAEQVINSVVIQNSSGGTVNLNSGKSGKKSGVKIGRNDSCPCGSGKKFKHCCGKTQ
ncbi:MAG: SEC-C domain-containing protein [Verrucomicrobia bacterium]|nr:SEC-C domain-containing protein [Verrucomicrobiota bacterium]